jgi:Protein of unknown function (DUF1153)
MVVVRHLHVRYVMGPDGSPLTIRDLPPPGTTRWVTRRKAQVVAAVCGGLLSLRDACARYNLSVEEFLSWQMAIERGGLPALRTTRIDEIRRQNKARS